MHVHGFVALSSQFLFLSLFLYNGVVVIEILIALSGLVLLATLSLFSPRTCTSQTLVSVTLVAGLIPISQVVMFHSY